MNWDKEDREQAEIALTVGPISIIEAHCQEHLRKALTEIDRLQSAASQAESRLCEGIEMARCALVNLDNLAPPGTLVGESPMIKIVRLQITQTIDALEGKPIDP